MKERIKEWKKTREYEVIKGKSIFDKHEYECYQS